MNGHTIILAGNGSYSNRGCEAIVRGTTALLQDALGECRFISNYFPTPGFRDPELETAPNVLHRPFPLLKKYSPAWIEEQINRKLFRKPFNFAQVQKMFHQSLKEGEAVLMLGGDNFGLDYPNKLIHFSLCQMGLEAKKPMIIWGATVGPFSSDRPFEAFAAKRLRQVTLICARETETVEYLAGINISHNVLLTADPSFFMQPLPCTLPAEVEAMLKAGCIGLNLSPLLYRYVKIDDTAPSVGAWVSAAAAVVQSITQRFNMPVLLIPHVTSEVGIAVRDDYLFMQRVALQLNNPEMVQTLEPEYSAAELKWIISRVRAFAGARTHSTLAAISTGVPTICIGYSMKARGITKDVYGHLDWLITGQDLVADPTALRDRLASLLQNEAYIRGCLGSVHLEMVGRAKMAAERVKDLLANV